MATGACYDVENNTIWTCSDEWVEEWGNPGNMAPHHIARRLGIVPIPTPDSLISMNDVVTILLHHLGTGIYLTKFQMVQFLSSRLSQETRN